MRRTTVSHPFRATCSLLLATALSAALVLALPGPAAVAGGPDVDPTGPAQPAGAPLSDTLEALDRATQALREPSPDPAAGRPEATLALRDLFVARRSLDGSESVEADRLLARPTDGASDPYDDSYSAPETKSCAAHVCVHWVRSGVDAPPDDAWAKKTLRVMEKVWRHHIGTLGYRKPAADGKRGGNAKFDVYLKDLGSRGLYGYCAPERRVRGEKKQASGFCVLDDDFAASQYGRAPLGTLKVTAAHEFFHAIQFAYDFTEDPWLLESTATWMEERFADGVNDNRSYLRYGQAKRAATPLDLFNGSGFAHYGNWVFWEYLSERYGNDVVRAVLRRAGTGGGLPDDYSTQALRKVLAPAGGLPRVYAAFAAANTQPALSYDEGAAFPGVAPIATTALRATARRTTTSTRINHLAAKTVKVTPASLKAKKWRLSITVDAPRRATSPGVTVLVKRDNGALKRRPIALDRSGQGSRTVGFSSRSVRWVSVTLANASTRFRCDSGSGFACEGRPRDQRERFTVTTTASRR